MTIISCLSWEQFGVSFLTAQHKVQVRFATTSRVAKHRAKGCLRVNGGGKRERLEIITQILLFCERAQLKAAIMYSTNLNYVQLKSYLNDLLFLKMLTQDGRTYVTTKKGYQFLKLFTGLNDILATPESLRYCLPVVPRVS
jgi:predicted transcriptional regulator